MGPKGTPIVQVFPGVGEVEAKRRIVEWPATLDGRPQLRCSIQGMTEQRYSAAFDQFLSPTEFIDSDHPDVRDYANELVRGVSGDIDRSLALFYPIRDDIRYSPYGIEAKHEVMTASYTLREKKGFCIQKAVLLAAAARVAGIPSRLGFADVRNHLATKRLLELLETDLFIFHGFTELYLEGKWVKATPAFNIELCDKFGVLPLDFDGRNDSVFQPYDRAGRKHMEYVRDRGWYADLPFDEMFAAFAATYPRWPDGGRGSEGDFYAEAEAEHTATSDT
jgi:transglutaminase-like putative cysteine protease